MKILLPCTLLAAVVLAGALPVSSALAQRPPGAAQQADMPVSAAQRQQLIDGIARELRKNYVFPEVAVKVEASLRQQHQRGAFGKTVSAASFTEAVNQHLQAASKDKHLHLFYSAEAIPEQAPANTADLAAMQNQNFGVHGVERLPFNIGYLNLSSFESAKAAAPSIGAAMTLLAHTDSLIIDLRKNGGGDPEAVTQLASYFLDQRTHLSDIYNRPANSTVQMWTTEQVAGQRYGGKRPVYILTSRDTFSAAEDFSYSLKQLGRVTIVGETTGGGAHPSDMMRIDPHFALSVPNSRTINQVSKSNWEGSGVAPDVSVAADDAYKTAQVAILKQLAASEKNPAKLGRLQARIAKVALH